jgi:hypothetical protein
LLTPSNVSYYYFNKDGSWYLYNGVPGDTEARGGAAYTTSAGDVVEQLSQTDLSRFNSEHFTAVDWKSRHEQIYLDDGAGNIKRTFRKDIKDVEQLPRRFTTTLRFDGKPFTFYVDEDGTYEGSDQKVIVALKFDKSRRERERRNMSLSPRKIRLPLSLPASPEKKTGKLFNVSVKVELVDDPFLVR